MASGSPVCISAHSSTDQGSTEASLRTGRTDPHRSPLAATPMVCGSSGAISGHTMETATTSRHTTSTRHRASRPTVATANRLAIERSRLLDQHISAAAVTTIQASHRPSTVRIYNSTWRSFCVWCDRQNHDPLTASTALVIDFLQAGLDSGLAPNTLRRQVSALSSVLVRGSDLPLSHDRLVQRFLRGATNLRPPIIHRFPTWDLNKVLTALTTGPFEPIREISLRLLSIKVAFLVAITSARRISELAALSIREELCIFHSDRVVLRLDPSFIPKINTTFHRAQEIILPNFCPEPRGSRELRWHTLDVRRALKIYMARTASFRRSDSLFVSFLPSSLGQKVSTTTLGRWIRACISTAYSSQGLPIPARITAHSTRSAATSAAWATQASLEEVCRAATWSSLSPFIRHYRLDRYASADASFGRRVLQQVHREEQPRNQTFPTRDNN